MRRLPNVEVAGSPRHCSPLHFSFRSEDEELNVAKLGTNTSCFSLEKQQVALFSDKVSQVVNHAPVIRGSMLSLSHTVSSRPHMHVKPRAEAMPETHSRSTHGIRRVKSFSLSTGLPALSPAATRSDVLTLQERQAQARAAAATAFKNDLLRKSEPKTQQEVGLQHKQSVRFENSPPADPEYNPYAFVHDAYDRKPKDSRKDGEECKATDSPSQSYYGPSFISTAPSSYRRLRRSRSLFSVTHAKYSKHATDHERSNSLNGTTSGMRARRSMSFLRGGTDFLPASYRQEKTKERKPLHPLPFSNDKNHQVDDLSGIPAKPQSLRMKVRRMSSTLVNSVKRAFFSSARKDEVATELPPQHVMSNRPYFGDYHNASELSKEQERSPLDTFMTRANSGPPSLRRVPSSIGYPYHSGSIRIVTPPTLTNTPLTANTWASSTTTSTLRSATGSQRLSIIPETTSKMDDGESNALPRPRNKALDTQRVYSAFLRVSRAKNNKSTAQEAEQSASEPIQSTTLVRNPSVDSHSSNASTIKKHVSTPQPSPDRYNSTPCPLPKQRIGTVNKENIPPTQLQDQTLRSRTNITIGPRITLYPPPEQTPNQEKQENTEQETVTRSLRHLHSAFFPYSAGAVIVGATPSPYKRATAMSPDAPSIYSRTTSGNSPQTIRVSREAQAHMDNSMPDVGGHRDNFVQLGRKVSLVEMSRAREDGFASFEKRRAHPLPDVPVGVSSARGDENAPFSAYLQGSIRLEEAPSLQMPSTSPSAVAGAFRLGFFNRGRACRDTGAVQKSTSGNAGILRSTPTRRHRVLTAKNLQGAVTDSGYGQGQNQTYMSPSPLTGIDANVGGQDSEQASKGAEKRQSWGAGGGLSSNLVQTQAEGDKTKRNLGDEQRNTASKPTTKYLFEVNGDRARDYKLAVKPLPATQEVMDDGERNVSISSATGAFL
ncbi:hypothetical protein BDZ91DRAFT_849979 [Kalaharituber pfeilii]|nr:hypothetical protein BDZ91DRAFT_849979 [Kalaharituber pfeilii]